MRPHTISDSMHERFDAACKCAAAKYDVHIHDVREAFEQRNRKGGMVSKIRHYVWFLLRCSGWMSTTEIAAVSGFEGCHSIVINGTKRYAKANYGGFDFADKKPCVLALESEAAILGGGLVEAIGEPAPQEQETAARIYELAIECVAAALETTRDEILRLVSDLEGMRANGEKSMVFALTTWAGAAYMPIAEVAYGDRWLHRRVYSGARYRANCDGTMSGSPIHKGVSAFVDSMASQFPREPFRALMGYRVQKVNETREKKPDGLSLAPDKKPCRVSEVGGEMIVEQSVFTEYRAACRIAGQIVGMTTADVDAGVRETDDPGARRPNERRARAMVACLMYAAGISSRDIAHFAGVSNGIKALVHDGARRAGYRHEINTAERRGELFAILTEGRDPAAVASLWGAA